MNPLTRRPLWCAICKARTRCHITTSGPQCPECVAEEIELNDLTIPSSVYSDRWDDLYQFQRHGVAWLADQPVGILGDQMGLGKTVQALTAHPTGCGLVVVCPAFLKGTWERECLRWRPDLRPQVLDGRGSFRWPEADEAVILNYEILPTVGSFPTPPGSFSLVSDEAHYVKSPRSHRTRRFRVLSKLVEQAGGRVWLLTGTPMLNRPSELWNVLMAIRCHKSTFGSWQRFAEMFGYYTGGVWGKVDPQVPEHLRKVMLARKRREVLPDLPTKTHRRIEVSNVSSDARRACDEVLLDLQNAGLDPIEIDYDDPDALNAVQQAAFAHISTARKLLAESKIGIAEEIASQYEAQDEPLVMFSAHRKPVEALGAREGWGIVYGDTPPKKRDRTVQDFQEGKLKGLALTIQAGGLGLTLTHAATALFVDLCWSPATNTQAEDRICRLGQTRGVQIIRLVAEHPVDKTVHRLLARKQALVSASVDAATALPGSEGVWRRRTNKNRPGRLVRMSRRRSYRRS